ncbi:hypothetical protein L3X38_003469 [Prunus dulcis]|uniref:Integrase catalytic domain-containing protein n=1 Tax=Prunus dulcis TaxID=3755 RepID=A0AAD4ZM36_PRUDU|nr:hypothetical protein L3X38_003469 [Prunus dulcis]
MTNTSSDMTNIAPYTSGDTIKIGNGEGLSISHIGTASLSGLHLNTIYHVPQLATNLLSVYQLCKDNNCWVIFDASNVYVQDKATKTLLFQGKSHKGLYPIPQSVSPSIAIPKQPSSVISKQAFLGQQVHSTLWHQRFGHVSNDILHHMLKQSQLSVHPDATPSICSFCLNCKMHRLPFSLSQSVSPLPFQKLHTNVWGPAPCVAYGGYRYYVSIIDDCTRYLWIFPLFHKSDVYLVFVKFHAFITNHFHASVQYLQSDGGGEYNSIVFKAFLANKGIVHELLCPYTPQQNGIAERKNRHIMDTAITLLATTGLSDKFWYYATAHAVFLINRMPCSVLKMDSPYVRLYGHVPDLKSLKIFGSAVYPLLRPYNHHKLEPCSTQCVFLGYSLGYKGFMCFHPQNQKVVLSRHIIHDELVFPMKNASAFSSQSDSSTPIDSLTPAIVVSMPSSPLLPRSPSTSTVSSSDASSHDTIIT